MTVEIIYVHEPKASALGSRGRYYSSERTKKSRNVCSNSFSAVRDLQTIGFKACEVYGGDFSILVPGTLRGSNSDFSTRRMRVWRESATAVGHRALLAVKQVACTLLEKIMRTSLL